jgi:hypothetical protein
MTLMPGLSIVPDFRFFWPWAGQNADERRERTASGILGKWEEMPWEGN